MKKHIVLVLAILLLSMVGVPVANTQESGTQTPADQPSSRQVTAVLDGIEVPMDVLMYAQTEYVGHAITKAEKISRDSKQLYRLRVDRDTSPDDHESFYLLYDEQWKLIGRESSAPPPPPPSPATHTQSSNFKFNQVRPGNRDNNDDKDDHKRRGRKPR